MEQQNRFPAAPRKLTYAIQAFDRDGVTPLTPVSLVQETCVQSLQTAMTEAMQKDLCLSYSFSNGTSTPVPIEGVTSPEDLAKITLRIQKLDTQFSFAHIVTIYGDKVLLTQVDTQAPSIQETHYSRPYDANRAVANAIARNENGSTGFGASIGAVVSNSPGKERVRGVKKDKALVTA